MKDFDKDDQNQTKDKTITIPSIEKNRALIGAPPEGSFINNGTLLGARRAKQRVAHRRQQEWGAYSALVTAVSRNGAPTAPWLAPRLVRQPLDSPFTAPS